MPDRVWIGVTFRAFEDDSGARYPMNAHVTLGMFEIQDDQDVAEVIAAAQQARNAVNARLRRWASCSHMWSAQICINEEKSSIEYAISDIMVQSQMHATMHLLFGEARAKLSLLRTRRAFHLSIEPLE